MENFTRGAGKNLRPQAADPFKLPKHAEPEAYLLHEQTANVEQQPDTSGRDEQSTLLEKVSLGLSPEEMRDLSQSLLRLADAVDQDWSPEKVRSRYYWPSKARRIERNAIELAKRAVRIRELARRRERYIPREMLGEPSWQMLLELFIQFAGQAKVSTKSLCIISGCPDTTALRHIEQLEAAGFVQRSHSEEDRRVRFVELTREGAIAVGSALKDFEI